MAEKQTEVGGLKTEPTENLKSEIENIKSENEKAAEPTDCRPEGPVDIWDDYDEDTIYFAEQELRHIETLVEGLEQDIKRKKLEVRANRCKAEYIRVWLRQRGVRE